MTRSAPPPSGLDNLHYMPSDWNRSSFADAAESTRSVECCGVRSDVRRSPKEETYERLVVFRDSRAYQQARGARGPFRFSPYGHRRAVRGRPRHHRPPLLGRAVRIEPDSRESRRCSSVPWRSAWPALWNSIPVRWAYCETASSSKARLLVSPA